MNRRVKFDVASSILGGEIRNRTNKQTHKQKTHKQTVTDISTPTAVRQQNNQTGGAEVK